MKLVSKIASLAAALIAGAPFAAPTTAASIAEDIRTKSFKVAEEGLLKLSAYSDKKFDEYEAKGQAADILRSEADTALGEFLEATDAEAELADILYRA